nr:hypothetical protein [Tanacetum cinerariifolium]
MRYISPVIAITPDLPVEELDNSLSMGDEHLNTILKIESNEVIKSSVKNLVPIPSESNVSFDNESECDVPVYDESSPIFTTFSNHVFDCNDDFTSSDDKEDNQVDDRFKKSEGYHVIPPPYTGNYMPPRADLSFVGLDDYVFKFSISKSITIVNEAKTSTSKTSKESLEKPKTVRTIAPIIEEWESDSEDDNVVEKIEVKKTVKPRLEKIEFVNARNTTIEN